MSERLVFIFNPPQFISPRSVFWSEQIFAAKPEPEESFPDAPPPPEAQIDFVILDLSFTHGTTQSHWRIVAPHQGAVVELPVLPVTLADVDIAPGDQVSVDKLQMARGVGGYDTVRAFLHQVHRPADLVIDRGFGRVVFEELAGITGLRPQAR